MTMKLGSGLRRHLLPLAIILLVSALFGLIFGLTQFPRTSVALFQPQSVCTYALKGPIVTVAEPSLLTGSDSITPELVRKVLERARSEGCRALVFTVESPGGDVAATHEIYVRILNFRRETRTPVVVYVGGLAASGGYYISLAADHIVVNPASMVGLVGAVGTLVSFKGLLDTLGIDVVTVKSGEYKDVGNSLREITETDVRFLRELVDAAFRQFAEVVRKTRDKLNPAYERDVFSAKVFLGLEALNAGLIDEVGTYEDAVSRARELAGLPRDAPVRELRVATGTAFRLPIPIPAGGEPLSPGGMKVLYIEPSHVAHFLFSEEIRIWRSQGR